MEVVMLMAEQVHKRYGPVRALAGFDLRIAAGEVVGLIGRNGAGKSTFAGIAAGLLRPDQGGVRVDGIDIARDPVQARRRLGLAGQELALYPTATVAENLRLFGGLHGLRGRLLHDRIEDAASALDVTDLLARRVGTLSGGQQRRVHTAAALLHEPAVLLLDEPTVGADPASRQALLATVRARARAGAAVCYTTHYLPELELLGATVALADAGRVVFRGTRAELLATLPPIGGRPPTLDDVFQRWSAAAEEALDVA
ncbi:ABC transporter ATP-binding protein [Micromonospora sp. NPDC048999]|uniref:ABC transporter ATP-binding protein n=1 Tax=Micromonospora sp. NPDC048999 TaxID=3155391 RepID=UPI0033FC4D79